MATALHPLSRALGKIFTPPKTDEFASARACANRLAKKHGLEIEKLRPGYNVWPGKDNSLVSDPFEGDHYCADWREVLTMVEGYVRHFQAVSADCRRREAGF